MQKKTYKKLLFLFDDIFDLIEFIFVFNFLFQFKQIMSNNQEELIKGIQELIGRKEVLAQKIAAAKMLNKNITEKLENSRQERKKEHEKLEMLKARVADVASAEKHAAFSVNKVKLDLKRKDALLNDFFRLVKQLHTLAADEHPIVKAKQLYTDWQALQANAPWMPEKRKLQEELLVHQQKAQQVQEELEKMQQQIVACNELLASHEENPFTNFCVMLADYQQKSEAMRKMMCREMETFKKLEGRMKHKGIELITNVSVGSSAGDDGPIEPMDGDEANAPNNANGTPAKQFSSVGTPAKQVPSVVTPAKQVPSIGVVAEVVIDDEANGANNANDTQGEQTVLNLVIDDEANGTNNANGTMGEQPATTQTFMDQPTVTQNFPEQPSGTQNFMDFFANNDADGDFGGGVDSSFNMNALFGGGGADTSNADAASTDFFAFMSGSGGNNNNGKDDDDEQPTFNFDFNFG